MTRRSILRIIAAVLTCTFLSFFLLAIVSASAESEETILYVIRPKTSFYLRKGQRDRYINFGTRLRLISNEGKFCNVELDTGETGYVYTAFVSPGKLFWLNKGANGNGVYLSPSPGMNNQMYGYAAGGQRMTEMAVALFQEGDYYYIASEEGCSGYAYMYDPNLQTYEQHLWEIQQQQDVQQILGDG